MNNKYFKEYADDWLALKKLTIKQTTFQRYEDCLNNHILPIFGNKQMNEINDEIIINYFITKQYLSFSTLKMNKYIIQAIINLANEYIQIQKIHFDYIKLKPEKQTNKALDDQDYILLTKYAMNNMSNISVCILLGLYTGLRIGEVCALQWKDVDFKQGCLYVSKTIVRIRTEQKQTKTCLQVTSPKTITSNRCVPIPEFVLNYLKKYKDGNSDDYISSNKKNFFDPRTIQKSFKQLMKKLNLSERYHFHSLRHTYGTKCIMHNIDVKSVCEMMGHSNVSITLSLYVHTSFQYKKELVNRFTAP